MQREREVAWVFETKNPTSRASLWPLAADNKNMPVFLVLRDDFNAVKELAITVAPNNH